MAKRVAKIAVSAASQSFTSDQVKLFPSSNRSDVFDRNAKLNTEQNLISIVNRLTSRDSFVIDGLEIPDGTTLGKGSCNIHGYYFKLVSDITLSKAIKDAASGTDKKYLCFQIRTQTNTITRGDTVVAEYVELAVLDAQMQSTNTLVVGDPKDNSLRSLDSSTTDKEFYGLKLVVKDANSFTSHDTTPTAISGKELDNWYLPIAENKNNNWATIVSNDDSGETHRWNTQKILAEDILVTAKHATTANDNNPNPQDLMTYLDYNMMLDDGEI